MIQISKIRVVRAGTVGYTAGKREEKILASKIKAIMNKQELSGNITVR